MRNESHLLNPRSPFIFLLIPSVERRVYGTIKPLTTRKVTRSEKGRSKSLHKHVLKRVTSQKDTKNKEKKWVQVTRHFLFFRNKEVSSLLVTLLNGSSRPITHENNPTLRGGLFRILSSGVLTHHTQQVTFPSMTFDPYAPEILCTVTTLNRVSINRMYKGPSDSFKG